MAIVDVFSRFVRARPIPDERAETIARVLIEDWIAVFGQMEWLLSDGGTNLVGGVIKEYRHVGNREVADVPVL